MTEEERLTFQRWVAGLFEGDERPRRELRLTPGEAETLRSTWPQARMEPLAPAGGKTWYAVTLPAVGE